MFSCATFEAEPALLMGVMLDTNNCIYLIKEQPQCAVTFETMQDNRSKSHGVGLSALSAFTWPCPLNELYPFPPWQTCAAPLLADGNVS